MCQLKTVNYYLPLHFEKLFSENVETSWFLCDCSEARLINKTLPDRKLLHISRFILSLFFTCLEFFLIYIWLGMLTPPTGPAFNQSIKYSGLQISFLWDLCKPKTTTVQQTWRKRNRERKWIIEKICLQCSKLVSYCKVLGVWKKEKKEHLFWVCLTFPDAVAAALFVFCDQQSQIVRPDILYFFFLYNCFLLNIF